MEKENEGQLSPRHNLNVNCPLIGDLWNFVSHMGHRRQKWGDKKISMTPTEFSCRDSNGFHAIKVIEGWHHARQADQRSEYVMPLNNQKYVLHYEATHAGLTQLSRNSLSRQFSGSSWYHTDTRRHSILRHSAAFISSSSPSGIQWWFTFTSILDLVDQCQLYKD